jgi:Fe-S-cluster containining protein
MNALRAYRALVNRVDGFLESVLCRYRHYIQCGPACSTCCQAELTVFPVEAWSIRQGLHGLPAHARLLLLRRGAYPSGGVCAALDKDHCLIYPIRPLICRTQGFPLLVRGPSGEREARYCERNFRSVGPSGITISGDCVLNLEVLNQALAGIQMQFAEQWSTPGRDPLPDRVHLLRFLPRSP